MRTGTVAFYAKKENEVVYSDVRKLTSKELPMSPKKVEQKNDNKYKITNVSANVDLRLPLKEPQYGSLMLGGSVTAEASDINTDEDALAIQRHLHTILAEHMVSALLAVGRHIGVSLPIEESNDD